MIDNFQFLNSRFLLSNSTVMSQYFFGLSDKGGHTVGEIEDNQLVIFDMKNISLGCVVRR